MQRMKMFLVALSFAAMGARASSAGTPERTMRESVPLNSSILLLAEADYERCSQQMDRVIALGNDRVNLVTTLHFVSDDGLHLSGFCFARKTGVCEPLAPVHLDLIRNDMSVCLRKAFAHHLKVSIVPHIDDGRTGIWRNYMVFDPFERVAGYSYQDAVIEPLVQALIQAKPQDAGVYAVDFALEGEMGGTLFEYPAAYANLTTAVRQELASFSAKVGVSVNHNQIIGAAHIEPASIAPLQSLLDSVDFLGISNYHSVSARPTPADFSRGIQSVMGELATLGLRYNTSKEVQFSEMGMGGANDETGKNLPATTPALAAATPWVGSGAYPYDSKQDPWTSPVMRQFRYNYHQALLEFLRTQPDTYFVGAAYLWSMASWDPQGVYFDGPEFRDDAIVDLIQKTNLLRK